MGTQADRSMLEGKSIVIFRAAIKSKWTRDPYERRLAALLRYHFMTCDDLVNIARHDLQKPSRW